MSEHEIVWQCAHCGAKGWGFRVSADWILHPDGWLTQEDSGALVCSLECARYVDMSDEDDMSQRSVAKDQDAAHHFSPEQLAVFRDRFGWSRTPRAGGTLCGSCALRPGQQVRIWPSRKRDLGEPEVGIVTQREGQLWIEMERQADRPRRSILLSPALVLDRLVRDGEWTWIQ